MLELTDNHKRWTNLERYLHKYVHLYIIRMLSEHFIHSSLSIRKNVFVITSSSQLEQT